MDFQSYLASIGLGSGRGGSYEDAVGGARVNYDRMTSSGDYGTNIGGIIPGTQMPTGSMEMGGQQWVRSGLSPQMITEARMSGMIPPDAYRFDPAQGHMIRADVAAKLDKKAQEISQEDKKNNPWYQKALDNGLGPMLLAAGFMGPAMAAGGMGAGGLAAVPEMGGGLGAFGSSGLTNLGAPLASEMGFVPGSFELGAGAGFGGEAVGATAGLSGGGSVVGEGAGMNFGTGGGGSNLFGGEGQIFSNQIGGPTGLDLGIEGLGQSSLQGFGGSGFGPNLNGGTLFGAANAAAGASGGGFWDGLQKLFSGVGSNADKIGGGMLSNLLPSVFSGLGKYFAGQEQQDALNSAADRADPFAGERPFYQGQLRDMVSNPNWMQQNPVFQNLMNPAIKETMAASSARGDAAGGNMLHDVTKTGVETGAKFYLPMLQQMGALAGGNFQPSWAGSIAAQGANSNMQNTNDIMGDIMMGLQPMNTALFGRNEKQGNEKPNIMNGGSGGGPNVMAQLGLA